MGRKCDVCLERESRFVLDMCGQCCRALGSIDEASARLLARITRVRRIIERIDRLNKRDKTRRMRPLMRKLERQDDVRRLVEHIVRIAEVYLYEGVVP